MFEQLTRVIAQVGERTSHWMLENGTTIEEAEQMLLKFLQQLSVLKIEQQKQQTSAQDCSQEKECEVKQTEEKSAEQPSEQPTGE
jgi:hypothetical protein